MLILKCRFCAGNPDFDAAMEFVERQGATSGWKKFVLEAQPMESGSDDEAVAQVIADITKRVRQAKAVQSEVC